MAPVSGSRQPGAISASGAQHEGAGRYSEWDDRPAARPRRLGPEDDVEVERARPPAAAGAAAEGALERLELGEQSSGARALRRSRRRWRSCARPGRARAWRGSCDTV